MPDSSFNCRPRQNAQGGSGPYAFFNFRTKTIAGRQTGFFGTPAVFPVLTKIAEFDLGPAASGIVALAMTSSIINEANGVSGLVVALDRGGMTSFQANEGADIFLSHLTEQNSTAGTRAASSRTNTFHMGESSAYLLEAGKRISVYGCATNGATNAMSYLITAYYVPATDF